MIATGALSLGVHVGILQGLGVPFPGTPADAPVWQYISRDLLHALGLIWLARLIRQSLPGGVLQRWFVLLVLSTTLTESFRGTFMMGYCTDAYTYALVTALPRYLTAMMVAAMIAAMTPLLSTATRQFAAAAIIGAMSLYILRPVSAALAAPVLKALSFLARPEWCALPYDWDVLLPAYLSFAEPTIGAFAAVILAWKHIPGSTLRRIGSFILIVLLIRRQLLAAPIHALWSDMPGLQGLASMGQYTLEALALGLLTALCWWWISPRGLR